MEALAALEAAAQGCDDAPPVSESGRSSDGQGGHGNIVTTPASKRRRLRGISGGLIDPKGELSPGTSQSPSSILKREDDQDNDVSVEGGGSDDDVNCLGCGRSRAHGKDWWTQDVCPWANNRRVELWCRDCHNCWRTCFSERQPLSLFGRYLKAFGM